MDRMMGRRMAELIAGITAERVRANLARVREEIVLAAKEAGRDPSEVHVLAATKYVAISDLPALAEAGIWLVGREPRAGSRGEGRRPRGSLRLALHRSAPEPARAGDRAPRAPDPLARQRVGAARARAPPPTGEAGDGGVDAGQHRPRGRQGRGAARGAAALYGALPVSCRRADGDAPARRRPRGEPPLVRRAARARLGERAGELSMGTSQDYATAVEEGATIVRLGSALFR